ncbi:MAG TPA: hypothetical protein EYP29_00265, partial [Thermoplasmata archaeon]|nr:hypothetical protein [Thermoplasmata archaeon]
FLFLQTSYLKHHNISIYQQVILQFLKDILDDLGIERVCCRRIFLSHPYDKETDKEPIDEAIHY